MAKVKYIYKLKVIYVCIFNIYTHIYLYHIRFKFLTNSALWGLRGWAKYLSRTMPKQRSILLFIFQLMSFSIYFLLFIFFCKISHYFLLNTWSELNWASIGDNLSSCNEIVYLNREVNHLSKETAFDGLIALL